MEDIVQIGLLVLILSLTIHYVWSRFTSRLPPGPPALPLIGNYFTFKQNPFTPLYEQLHHLASTYGGVMSIQLGTTPFLVLNSYEAIKEGFERQQNVFSGRQLTYSGDLVTSGGSNVALADFSPQWAAQRRLMMMALKKIADKATVSRLVAESTREVCELMVSECEETGRVADVHTHFYLLVYNIITSIVAGKRYALDDDEFQTLLANFQTVVNVFPAGLLADFIPALKFVPTPATIRLKQCLAEIFEFFNRIIKEHKADIDGENPRDITDAVLMAKGEMDREGKEDLSFFTHKHMRHTLQDVFGAGTETTTHTLLWAILYCLHYPEYADQAYEEIERVVGGRMLMAGDRANLPYTESFLLEAMRMRPQVPLGLPHTTTASTKLYGYHIPKGMSVLPNFWACHYDPRYWVNPTQFQPDRFINTSTGKVQAKREGFLPFGTGRRSCAGELLARVDTFLIFATLLQQLKFSPVSGQVPPTLLPAEDRGVIFCVSREFEVTVRRR